MVFPTVRRRHLGIGIELRPVQRRAADHWRTGDAGVDPRRSALFRGELFDALDILNRGDIEFERLKGSWAGAMGQVQFMPSSYLKFAEDFDGDGRRDIWGTSADIFASIANYMTGHGWTSGETWGREVKATPEVLRRVADEVERRQGTCRASRNMTIALPVASWHGLGVANLSGAALPAGTPQASMVVRHSRLPLTVITTPARRQLLARVCDYVAPFADRIASTDPLPQPAKRKRRRGPGPPNPARPRTMAAPLDDEVSSPSACGQNRLHTNARPTRSAAADARRNCLRRPSRWTSQMPRTSTIWSLRPPFRSSSISGRRGADRAR